MKAILLLTLFIFVSNIRSYEEIEAREDLKQYADFGAQYDYVEVPDSELLLLDQFEDAQASFMARYARANATPKPVSKPTIKPIKTPVETPVKAPVKPPVKTPVKAPIKTPVKAPVKTPVKAPVKTPVKAPVKTPVKPPIKAPVKPIKQTPTIIATNTTSVAVTNTSVNTTTSSSSSSSTSSSPSRRCSCDLGVCKCCTGMILDLLNQKACMKVTYHPGDFAFDVSMSFNDRVLYENSLSGKSPKPICLGPPRFPNIKLCAKFYDVFFPGRNFHFCLQMNGKFGDFELFNINFDCLRMGANGIAHMSPEENGGLTIPNPQGGVDAVIDAGEDDIDDYDEHAKSLLDIFQD